MAGGWERGEDRAASDRADGRTMAHDFRAGQIAGSKKIGARRPRRSEVVDRETSWKDTPGSEMVGESLGSSTGQARFGRELGADACRLSQHGALPMVMPISRAVMVPPANRANSESCRPHRAPATPSPTRARTKPQPSSALPTSRRHQPSQAEAQRRRSTWKAMTTSSSTAQALRLARRHTGSFLGHCKDCGKNDRDVDSADWGILDAISSNATGGPNGGTPGIHPRPGISR